MAYRWETPASVWLEDEDSGQFALAASEGLGRIDWGAQQRARVGDVAHLLGASLPTACTHAPIYPEGFAFCPACGRPLERLAGRRERLPDWWGPYADQALPRHVPHGLPVTSLALGDSLEERPAAPETGRFDAAMPAPPNAHCVFAAAGYGFPEQRLLALSPARGVLQYWDPLAEVWHVLLPEEGAADLSFGGSDYGWLPASAQSAEPPRGDAALAALAGHLAAAPRLRRPHAQPRWAHVADRARRPVVCLPRTGHRQPPARAHRRRTPGLCQPAVPARPSGARRALVGRARRRPAGGRFAGAAAAAQLQQQPQPAERAGAALPQIHRPRRRRAGQPRDRAHHGGVDRPAQ